MSLQCLKFIYVDFNKLSGGYNPDPSISRPQPSRHSVTRFGSSGLSPPPRKIMCVPLIPPHHFLNQSYALGPELFKRRHLPTEAAAPYCCTVLMHHRLRGAPVIANALVRLLTSELHSVRCLDWCESINQALKIYITLRPCGTLEF